MVRTHPHRRAIARLPALAGVSVRLPAILDPRLRLKLRDWQRKEPARAPEVGRLRLLTVAANRGPAEPEAPLGRQWHRRWGWVGLYRKRGRRNR
jgi:hypothetical protein